MILVVGWLFWYFLLVIVVLEFCRGCSFGGFCGVVAVSLAVSCRSVQIGPSFFWRCFFDLEFRRFLFLRLSGLFWALVLLLSCIWCFVVFVLFTAPLSRRKDMISFTYNF